VASKAAAAEAAARAARAATSQASPAGRESSAAPSQDTTGQGSQGGSSGSDGSSSSDRQNARSQAPRPTAEAPAPARTSSGFGQVLDEQVGSVKAVAGKGEPGGSSILSGASAGDEGGSGGGKAASSGGSGVAAAQTSGSSSAAVTSGPQAFAPASGAPSAAAAAPAGSAHAGSAPAAAAVEQMVARLSALDHGRSALVSLEPPELGRVLVRFMRRGKGWKVQLIADRPEVAQALNRDIGRLSQVLGRDSDVVDVEVSSDTGESRSGGSWTSEDGEQGAFSRSFAPLEPEAQPASLARPSPSPNGLSSLDVTG
jgi:flagellar hook-length control protein FliK